MPSSSETTRTLVELARGDELAADLLAPAVYDELRDLAERYMRRERRDHTLQATALAHEAYMRLIDQSRVDWKGRAHFLGVAAQVMRRILVDHARRHAAAARAEGEHEATAGASSSTADEVDLLALDEALGSLRRLSKRQARVVELRFFGGLSVEEAAHVLGVSPRTVKGDWQVARAWLQKELGH